MWIVILSLIGSVAMAAPKNPPERLVKAPKPFDCKSTEGLMGLKALYLCQSKDQYGMCGSLAGYLAGRPVTAQAAVAAQTLIRQAATTQLEPVSDTSLSSLRSMASGQWWRVVWDNSPIPVPAVGLAMRAITMMIGLGGRTACGEPGDADINTDHSSTCTAETSRISKLNYDFLNRPSRDQLQSLKIAKVCNHYRKRYEEQIRGGTYKGLSCPSSSTGGELISTVGEGNAAVERRLKYNDQGVLHNIELRFAHTPGGVNLVELVNSAPTKVTNREPVEKLRGRRTTTLPIELVGPSYPAFNELAALKLESAELISCCRIKDTSLLRQCRDGFNTPARGPPDLIETGGAVK